MARRLVVTDADNTLWDTNATYAIAQLEMLTAVCEATGSPPPLGDTLAFVRGLDEALAMTHPAGLQYPPSWLAESLAKALNATLSPQRAITLGERFVDMITMAIPELRLGVSAGLTALHDAGCRVLVLTENAAERCNQLLRHHGLIDQVNHIVSEAKSPATFNRIGQQFKAPLGHRFSIGDQLDRDIEYAAHVGFRTVYFPSAFSPPWARSTIAPDYTVDSYEMGASMILGVDEGRSPGRSPS